MYPILLIAIGVAVLTLGKRLAVLGAAVGALLGVAFLNIFSVEADALFQIGVVALLAVGGFFLVGAAKGIVNIVLVALCALAGALIMIGFLDLFGVAGGLMYWLLAAVGGLVGWLLYRSFSEMALVILTGLIGALLITRGLTGLLPNMVALQGWLGTLLVIVLTGAGIGLQGGFFAKRKAAAEAKSAEAAAQAAAATPPPAPPVAATPLPVQPAAAAPLPQVEPLPPQSDGQAASTTTTPPSTTPGG